MTRKTFEEMPDEMVNPRTGGRLSKIKVVMVSDKDMDTKFLVLYKGPGLRDEDPEEMMLFPIKT